MPAVSSKSVYSSFWIVNKGGCVLARIPSYLEGLAGSEHNASAARIFIADLVKAFSLREVGIDVSNLPVNTIQRLFQRDLSRSVLAAYISTGTE